MSYQRVINIHFHFENKGPTGSWKDRYAAALLPLIKSWQYKKIALRSSGNLGLAIAFQAKKFGIKCFIEPSDGTPEFYYSLWENYDAQIVSLVEDIIDVDTYDIKDPNNNNRRPGFVGYGNIADEIVKSIGKMPDMIALPCCYGDGAIGIANRFQERYQLPEIILGCASGNEAAATSIATDSTSINVQKLLNLGALRISVNQKTLYDAQKFLVMQGIKAELSSVAGLAALGMLSDKDIADKTIAIVVSAIERN